jgi:hypothetical protein
MHYRRKNKFTAVERVCNAEELIHFTAVKVSHSGVNF